MSKHKSRILIIDDEIEIVRALQRSLVAHGYEVLVVDNGEKALDAVEQHHPDLLLLDLGADDYVSKPFGINEVLARIRVALRHAAYLPVVDEPGVTVGPLEVDLKQRT